MATPARWLTSDYVAAAPSIVFGFDLTPLLRVGVGFLREIPVAPASKSA